MYFAGQAVALFYCGQLFGLRRVLAQLSVGLLQLLGQALDLGDAFVGIAVRMTEIENGKPGETMEILKIEKGGQRISLSMKRLEDDRWEGITDRYTPGEKFEGTILRKTDFGLFVELDDIYVDGLVHITALDRDYFHFDPIGHRLTGWNAIKNRAEQLVFGTERMIEENRDKLRAQLPFIENRLGRTKWSGELVRLLDEHRAWWERRERLCAQAWALLAG